MRIDQGTMGTDSTGQLTDLRESAYLVEIDSRLGSLCQHRPDDGVNTVRTATENFIDDDHIATYLITNTSWNDSVRNMSNQETEQTPIDGQLGSTLSFSIQSNTNLATSDALFNRIGYETSLGSPATPCRVIETTVRVTGYTTGYSVDLPFMFIKKQ
ncbi:MAG: hypothetical protein EBT93_11180 [Alphaproteobacteria bacterium]|nr:hypothetical protein [Alphaproteobacteria bacterium]